MTTVYVDLPAVQELANQLARIHEALDGVKDDFRGAEGDMGSSDVASALGHFCSGWRDGRKTILDEIGNLIQAVKGAHQEYLHSENSIKDSFAQAGVNTLARPSVRAR